MPKFIDSVVLKEKLQKKYLTLDFDEGDSVLSCIRQAMLDNGVREADVSDVSGSLTTGSINSFEGQKFKKVDFANKVVLRASGHFKVSGGDLWGSLHVFTEGRKPISGTVIKATASQGFQLKLSFLP